MSLQLLLSRPHHTQPLPDLSRPHRQACRASLVRQLHRIEEDQRKLKRCIGTIYTFAGLVLVILASIMLGLNAVGIASVSGKSSDPPVHQFNASAIVSPGFPDRRPSSASTPTMATATLEPIAPGEATAGFQSSLATGVKRQPAPQEAENTLPTPTVSESQSNEVSDVVNLSIPAIGLAAPTVSRNMDANGTMETAGPFEIAWYDFTSHPQRGGNAVFSGHVDYVGVGPAVFWSLGNVREGDEVEITLEDGTRLHYQVNAMTVVPAASDVTTINEIIGPTSVPAITLFTCAGQFDNATGQYEDRLIVRAERIVG